MAAQKAVLCSLLKSRLAAEQAAGGWVEAGAVSQAFSEMMLSSEALYTGTSGSPHCSGSAG